VIAALCTHREGRAREASSAAAAAALADAHAAAAVAVEQAAAAAVHTSSTTTPHKQQHSSHADSSSSSSSSSAAVPDTGDILHVHFAAAPNTPAAAAATAATTTAAQFIADAATPLPLSSPPHSIRLEQLTRQKGAAPPRGGVMGTDVRTQQHQQQRSQHQQQQSQQQQQSHQQQLQRLQQQGKRVSFSEEQEAFRPSYEVFTPGRAALGSVQYRAPEKRVPGAVAPASTVARPNYHDAIRRVSVVVFQHIQVSSRTCCNSCSCSSNSSRSYDSVLTAFYRWLRCSCRLTHSRTVAALQCSEHAVCAA
jgi:hypothetical protein